MRFVLLLLLLLRDTLCQCPPGYSTLFNNNQLATCSPQNSCSCPSIRAGYFCQFSSQNNQYVCCGVSSPQCPTSSAQLNNGMVQTCQSNNDCGSGYFCNQNTCCASPSTQCGSGGGSQQCANGQVVVNGVCTNQVLPGSFCQSSAVCSGGSQCVNSFCQCPNGQSAQNGVCPGNSGNNQCGQGMVLVNNQCLQQVSPGSSCSSSLQCLDSSVCNGICTCQNNLQQVNGYCVQQSSGNCPSSQTMINGICQTYSTVTGPCVGNAQCVGGSTCSGSTCQCPSGTQNVFLNSNGVSRGYCQSSNSGGNCPFGQVFLNGQCVQQIQIGGFGCQTAQQCMGNAQCFNGQCQCAQGTTQQNGQCISSNGQCSNGQVLVNGQCMQQIQLGSFGCSISQQCIGNGQCFNGMCQCAQGTTQQNGQCVNTGGGQCQANQVLVNGQCMQQIQLGSFGCSFTQQCMGNSQCLSGQCQCAQGSSQQNGQCITNNGQCSSGQILVNGQCMQQIQLGSFGCSFTQQCLGNSQCLNSQCLCAQGTTQQNGQCTTSNGQCLSGQVQVNGQCMQQIQLGAFGCSFSQQCMGNSQCISGQCQCAQGTTQQNGQCIQGGGGGVGCQLGSVMINGFCTQQVPPGSQCSSSVQCLDNSICNFNTCTCQNNAQSLSGYCVPQSNGVCSNTQTFINNQCVTYSVPGGSCLSSQQCLGGSQCLNSVCTCSTNSQRFCLNQNGFQSCYCISSFPTGINCQFGQVLVNGQCMQQVQLGSFGCSFSQQCTGNSQCLNGMCQCGQGSTQQGSQCITLGGSVQSAPGTFCSTTSQCLDNSVCTFNNCTCQNGAQALYGYCLPMKTDFCSTTQIMVNNQCLTYSVLGGSCQGDRQCLGGSFCNSGICACRQGIQQVCTSSNQCYCQGGSGTIPIGSFGCQTASQCLGNAQCFNGVCQCPTGTVQQNGQCITNINCQSYQVQQNGQCLDTVSIGQQCTTQAQCVTPNSVCSGTCTCSSSLSYNGTACTSGTVFCSQGTVSVFNTCRSLVALGQFCQSTAQCIGFGTCGLNQQCVCPAGTTNINNVCRSSGMGPCNVNQVQINGQCFNMVQLGQACSFSQQCQGSGICTNGACVCPSGTTNYGNGVCTGASSDSGLCSAGETPQYTNNQLINCLTSPCPSASYCKYNSVFSKYVCCRPQSSTLTCANPAYSVVYQNGSPLNCLMSPCPMNSICEYNNNSGQYVCCQQGSGTGTNPSSTCLGTYYTYSNGFPFVCTSDSACTATSSTYRYCRSAPGQTFSVCCSS